MYQNDRREFTEHIGRGGGRHLGRESRQQPLHRHLADTQALEVNTERWKEAMQGTEVGGKPSLLHINRLQRRCDDGADHANEGVGGTVAVDAQQPQRLWKRWNARPI